MNFKASISMFKGLKEEVEFLKVGVNRWEISAEK